MTKLLGAGQFGQVHQGRWKATTSENEVEVAVKTLQEGADEEDKVKFLQEAAIMGQFSHPSVVKLYGVVTEGEPVSFFYYCTYGNKKKLIYLSIIFVDNVDYRTASQRRSQGTTL